MLVTDEITHYFTCPQCGNKHQIRLKERGYLNKYGLNTSWDEGKQSLLFEIKWTEPGSCGPEVIECFCRRCQTPAVHHEK